MNNKTLIEINNDKKIIKLFKIFKINIYDISYTNNKANIIVKKEDLSKISKLTKYKIIKEYGIKNIKNNIKENLRIIIILIAIIIVSIFISRITIKINIDSSNKKIVKTIQEELQSLGLKEYNFQKTSKELQDIKDKIKKNNKNTIEWINIKKEGMTYKINIEEKINAESLQKKEYCNIIANQEGIITKIITKKGTQLVEQNDHVNKEDILISGKTTYNEETKNIECAEGTASAKTWYTINISIPKTHKKEIKKKNYRYNVYLKKDNNTKKIFKSRIKNPIKETYKILNIFNTKIIIIKEYEKFLKEEPASDEEIENKIKEMINNKMDKILKKDGRIIEQKVLKKNEFNSTIELEIFIIAEEKISTQKILAKDVEE